MEFYKKADEVALKFVQGIKAASTGQKDDLPDELGQAVWDLVKPNLEGIQGSGMFGAWVKVSEPADLQIKLLAALGKDRTKFRSS